MKKIYSLSILFLATYSMFASKVIIPESVGNFDNGLDSWVSAVIADHEVSLDNTSKITGTNSALLKVANTPSDNADLQLNYIFSAFKGAKYKLRFKVIASVETQITVGLCQDRAPFTSVLSESITVGTSVQTYEFVSSEVLFGDGMFKLCFYAGDSPANTCIWIDDVRLLDTTDSTTDNIAVNGDFEEVAMEHSYGEDQDENEIIGITPGWKTINYVNGDHSIYEGANALQGNRSYSITREIGNASNPNLSEVSNAFYAHPGEEFKITFDISADVPFYGDIHSGPIHFAGGMPIGAYVNAVDKVNDGDLIMSGKKSWQSQTAIVTNENKGYYWFVLQFGWIDIPDGELATFLIDNVKIERTTALPSVYTDMDANISSTIDTQNMSNNRIYLSGSNTLKIELEEQQLSEVSIYAQNGINTFKTTIHSSTEISLPTSLASGLYIVKLVQTGKEPLIGKIIIQ